MKKTVVELFAGVGGFRVGLNKIKGFDGKGKAIESGEWDFVWANQWEPATKEQHAYDCYATRFGKEESSNEDISLVDKKTIPDHTLLVGGFPCQDYSVARSLSQEKGIQGKKGVLWWQINDILKTKQPKFVLLENVDRLLKAPSKQRGQAFGIMLRCFADNGYGVQWKVINAADYGHPQRRRRTFIFAFHKSTNYYKNFKAAAKKNCAEDILLNGLMFSKPFPSIKELKPVSGDVIDAGRFPTVFEVSEKFSFPFENTGYSLDGNFFTMKQKANYQGPHKTLGEILDSDNVPAHCYKVDVAKFQYLKGAKHILRIAKNGHEYYYSEGPIPFPDKLDAPGRTMLTSEATTNRSTHFILDPKSNKYRVLTPIECERMDEFPDDWTATGMPPKRRYFIAGNALVCGLITSMGEQISKIIDEE